jgi:small subunit ribosomal protein S12
MGLIRKLRQRRKFKSRSPALYGNPQQSAIVKKSFITTPRKPNSAKRRTAKVVIRRSRRVVDIYLEGIDFNKLNPHSLVLVRGKGPRDLPGVNYHAIRGKGDFQPLLNRRKGRSKYGAKRPIIPPAAEK